MAKKNDAKSKAAPKKAAAPAKRAFEDLIAPHAPDVQMLCTSLRQLVLASLPAASEGIYGGAKVGLALYSIGDGKKVVCGIQPSGGQVLFYLHHLKEADSPRLKLEGQGKHALHIKLQTLDDETRAELRRLINLAASRA